VKYKNRSNISNNWGNWNHQKTIKKLSKHDWKAHQDKTENSHIWHCAHTSKLLMQNYKTFTLGHIIITHHILCPHSGCNITCCREMLFSRHIIVKIL